MLAITFVISKQEQLVFLERPAQSSSEHIALELRDASLVKEIARVQRAVAKKFVHAAMQLIGARCGNDAHLSARPLAVLRSVGVRHHVEFAHRVHSQQLAARASRRNVDERSAGELDAIQQKEILLRTPPRYREHVAERRIGSSHAAGPARSVVHDARVQRNQFVKASAVQRQILHLPLAHQAGSGLVRQFHRRRLFSTVTVCFTSPTCSVKSTVACSPTTRSRPVLVCDLKFSFEAAIS